MYKLCVGDRITFTDFVNPMITRTGVVTDVDVSYDDRSHWRPFMRVALDEPYTHPYLPSLYGDITHATIHRDDVISLMRTCEKE